MPSVVFEHADTKEGNKCRRVHLKKTFLKPLEMISSDFKLSLIAESWLAHERLLTCDIGSYQIELSKK